MLKHLSREYLSSLPKPIVFRMYTCISYFLNLDEETQDNLIKEVCARIERDIEVLYL